MCTEKFETDGSLKSRVTQLRQDLAKMSNEEINQKVLQLVLHEVGSLVLI